MKALCIVYENIDDWDAYDQYRSQVMATLQPFEARFLVRGGRLRPSRVTCRSTGLPWSSSRHARQQKLGISRMRIKPCFRFGWRRPDASSSSSTPLRPPEAGHQCRDALVVLCRPTSLHHILY